jgi:ADP-ribose pyrophosphatase YjhB (NUDIX family)
VTDLPKDGHTRWRPQQAVRAIAVALVYRGSDVLVMAVKDDSGALKGWRPLGGAIEFGESAQQAVTREFLEEIGKAVRCVKQLCLGQGRERGHLRHSPGQRLHRR